MVLLVLGTGELYTWGWGKYEDCFLTLKPRVGKAWEYRMGDKATPSRRSRGLNLITGGAELKSGVLPSWGLNRSRYTPENVHNQQRNRR